METAVEAISLSSLNVSLYSTSTSTSTWTSWVRFCFRSCLFSAIIPPCSASSLATSYSICMTWRSRALPSSRIEKIANRLKWTKARSAVLASRFLLSSCSVYLYSILACVGHSTDVFLFAARSIIDFSPLSSSHCWLSLPIALIIELKRNFSCAGCKFDKFNFEFKLKSETDKLATNENASGAERKSVKNIVFSVYSILGTSFFRLFCMTGFNADKISVHQSAVCVRQAAALSGPGKDERRKKEAPQSHLGVQLQLILWKVNVMFSWSQKLN